MSVYETARKLRLPGIEITAVINPALLTVRIRNSAIRMIEDGVITGWGQAAKLARVLMEDCKAPHIKHGRVSYRYTTVYNCKDISDDIRAKLTEAGEADVAIYKMELIEEINKFGSEWRKRELDNLNKNPINSFSFDTLSGDLAFTAHSKAAKSLFMPIVIEMLASHREDRLKYSAKLKGTDLIPVKFE